MLPCLYILQDLLAYLQRIALYCHQLNMCAKVKAEVQNISGEMIVSGLDSATSLIQVITIFFVAIQIEWVLPPVHFFYHTASQLAFVNSKYCWFIVSLCLSSLLKAPTHRASDFPDLLPEMPRYCCLVEIFYFGFFYFCRDISEI